YSRLGYCIDWKNNRKCGYGLFGTIIEFINFFYHYQYWTYFKKMRINSEPIKVYPKFKDGKGTTLFAKADIRKDEVILIIGGNIIATPTIYTIPIDEKLFIDPVPFDNLGRYLCHDCEPNAGIKDRNVLVAMRDIY